MGHDKWIWKLKCFLARFNVGQNLYIYKQSIREAATNWTAAVSDWYYEVSHNSDKCISLLSLASQLLAFSKQTV
jgi:hypothetical protein